MNQKKFFKILNSWHTDSYIYKLLDQKLNKLPRKEIMIELDEKNIIPWEAWKNIKKWLEEEEKAQKEQGETEPLTEKAS